MPVYNKKNIAVDIDKLRNIPYSKRGECVVCGNKLSPPLIDLPAFPLTEIFTAEIIRDKIGFMDQHFHFCSHCGQGSIANIINREFQYNSAAYFFRTSKSATGMESADFFVDFVEFMIEGRELKHIVDVGCNDLYTLKSLRSRARKLTGIDPILKGQAETGVANISVVTDFFEDVELNEKADLVLCKDTLEHIPDPKEFLKGILRCATDDALFVFQFPSLEVLLNSGHFEQIFHQHLNYFSMRSIRHLLDELGCELLHHTYNLDVWGDILIAFRKGRRHIEENHIWKISDDDVLRRYEIFKDNMALANRQLSAVREDIVYGYGAAFMLPILAYHLKNDLSKLDCVVDDDERKEGIYYINLPIEIRQAKKISDWSQAAVLITAINSRITTRRIIEKVILLNPKKIILPLGSV